MLAVPEVVEVLANELVLRLGERNIGNVGWVIGSAYAAITFSYEVARQLGARHGFTEKDPANPKKMVWNRLTIPAGVPVLQCEELITTFGTVNEVRRAVQEGNKEPVDFLPEIATAFFRPEKIPDISNIVSLITKEVKVWKPADCPLCAQGSPRLRPRATQENWARLTGKTA